MRVIAGTWGGRRLQAPPGDATRPTSDRVREALFSVLARRVDGARVLDLFAGSGALGIEALSRGAASATFVDSAPAALKALRANLDALGAEAEVRPYRLASRLGGELSAILPAVLAPGAAVVAESDRRDPLDLELPLLDERRYGDTLIRIHGSR
jgi:16S rRNA (guanine966-N2)-methyltransferase